MITDKCRSKEHVLSAWRGTQTQELTLPEGNPHRRGSSKLRLKDGLETEHASLIREAFAEPSTAVGPVDAAVSQAKLLLSWQWRDKPYTEG